MAKKTVEDVLDEVVDLRGEAAALRDELAAEELRLCPKLAAVRERYAARIGRVEKDLKAAEAEVKKQVLRIRETVKTDRIMAVWCDGRVKWDDAGLLGFAAGHPEYKIEDTFRSVGEPSVALREIKEK